MLDVRALHDASLKVLRDTVAEHSALCPAKLAPMMHGICFFSVCSMQVLNVRPIVGYVKEVDLKCEICR